MVQSAEVIIRMREQIRQWEAAGDRRAIFLECYCLMTSNMLLAIEDGRFHDGVWARQLLERFAEYYFVALEAYSCKDEACASVWSYTHDCSCGQDLHVLQHLLLGINAHINYDLVLSLVDVLRPEWAGLSAVQRRQRYEDHRLVNQVIAETIDLVQDQIVERYDPRMDLVDRLLGRLDERLLSALITRWREGVWEKAMELLALPVTAHDDFCKQLEADVLKRSKWILLS